MKRYDIIAQNSVTVQENIDINWNILPASHDRTIKIMSVLLQILCRLISPRLILGISIVREFLEIEISNLKFHT